MDKGFIILMPCVKSQFCIEFLDHGFLSSNLTKTEW